MSRVSTYVRMKDGQLYKNPTLKGKGWFICFDDDDPPELVIKVKSDLKPHDILRKIVGLKHVVLTKNGISGRIFTSKGDFEDAKSYFFELTERIDSKFVKHHDGIVDEKDIWQGVIYDPKK